MPTVFIHCGAGKTGTSFLQVLFARYEAELRASGVIYPKNAHHEAAREGRVTSGNGIEMANYLSPDLPHRIADKNAFPEQFDQLLADADGADILYSSEFINFSDTARAGKIKETIDRHGYRPRIIYLVRDVGSAAISSYSQGVKRSGYTFDFYQFLGKWTLPYRQEIRAQKEAFSRSDLSIYNYEVEKDKLAELFFRDILKATFVPQERTTVNRSLTAKELELLRVMNATYPPDKARRLATFTSNALLELEKPTSNRIDQTAFDILSQRFARDVDFVNRFVTRGEGICISRDVAPDSEPVVLDDFETSVMAILGKLVEAVDRPGRRRG